MCAFSGGGSALFPAPRPPLMLGEKQETTRLLLECGATIFELNSLRKHMSLGQRRATGKIAYPARVVSLFLSDVVGDPLDVIASGPTVADPSTFADCIRIVERYGLSEKLPVFRAQVVAGRRRRADRRDSQAGGCGVRKGSEPGCRKQSRRFARFCAKGDPNLDTLR